MLPPSPRTIDWEEEQARESSVVEKENARLRGRIVALLRHSEMPEDLRKAYIGELNRINRERANAGLRGMQARKAASEHAAVEETFSLGESTTWQDEQVKQCQNRNRLLADLIRSKLQRFAPTEFLSTFTRVLEQVGEDASSGGQPKTAGMEAARHGRAMGRLEKEATVLRIKVGKLQTELLSRRRELANSGMELQQAERELSVRRNQAVTFKSDAERLTGQLEGLHEAYHDVPEHGDSSRRGSSPDEELAPTSSLSGTIDRLRSNLDTKIKENRYLQVQLLREKKQKRLFEAKLRAAQHELRAMRQGGALLESDQRLLSPCGDARGRLLEQAERVEEKTRSWETPEGASAAFAPLGDGEDEENDRLRLRQEFMANVPVGYVERGFAAHVLQSRGYSPFAYLDKVDRPDDRARCVRMMCREFALACKQAQRTHVLVQDLQEMNRITDVDQAIRFAHQTMWKTLNCDRASYWIVDERAGVAWTKVSHHESGTMTTMMLPLERAGSLVGAATRERKCANVADAYADRRFDRIQDQITGYRTKAVVAVPIMQAGQLQAVLECSNKLATSSSVFDDQDVFLLYVVGYAMQNVLRNCVQHRDAMHMTRRRDTLLLAAEDFFLRCRSKRGLLSMLTERMTALFQAQHCSLVIVYANKMERMDLDPEGNVFARESVLNVGLAGGCVSSGQPSHVDRPRADHRYSPQVDLELKDGAGRLHSWPLKFEGRVSAVVQFSQSFRPSIRFGDDGQFDETSQIHVDLLQRFLAMVHYYVEKWWPSDERFLRRDHKVGKRMNAYRIFKQLLSPDDWEHGVEIKAAQLVQRQFRAQKAKRVNQDITANETAQEVFAKMRLDPDLLDENGEVMQTEEEASQEAQSLTNESVRAERARASIMVWSRAGV